MASMDGYVSPAEQTSPAQSHGGTVYLTVAQIHRLAALANDALIGIQFTTDSVDGTGVYGSFVDYDQNQTFFAIAENGSWEDQT